ncbi:MAG: 5'/3'-nucleotidase SurE [Pseudomonadota bacterium]|nr:5'/3'-nucleotidase SurE [Pseudomonadota bacterium]
MSASNRAKRFRRILVTNDDGVWAPGLAVAEAVAADLAEEVWVVAPDSDNSGVSRKLTIQEPVRLEELAPRRFAVTDTPADCVIMGLGHVMADSPPDLVLSGVNSGANIAAETSYSGTVGAAITAHLMGWPAIALSQAYRDRKDVPWATAAAWLPRAVAQVLDGPDHFDDCFFNINVPAVAAEAVIGIELTRQGRRGVTGIDVERRTDLRENDYFWFTFRHRAGEAAPDSDVAALRRGAVSITPIGFDQTADAVLAALASAAPAAAD